MRALVYMGERHLEVVKMDDPRPGPGEALIEVERSGVCGSDLYIYEGRRKVQLPRILGHEFVGIAETGPLAGQRVVGEINCVCNACEMCSRGLGNHCSNRTVVGILNHDGAFADSLVVPQ